MGGAKVELFISDCESDPKKVATEVEKMITLRKPQVMLHVDRKSYDKSRFARMSKA